MKSYLNSLLLTGILIIVQPLKPNYPIINDLFFNHFNYQSLFHDSTSRELRLVQTYQLDWLGDFIQLSHNSEDVFLPKAFNFLERITQEIVLIEDALRNPGLEAEDEDENDEFNDLSKFELESMLVFLRFLRDVGNIALFPLGSLE